MKTHTKYADCTCPNCKREAAEFNRAHFWETFGIFETEINKLLDRIMVSGKEVSHDYQSPQRETPPRFAAKAGA